MKTNSLLNFENRTVLITGAASGIGRETAVLFAGLGAKLLLVDIDQKNLAQTKELCGGNSYTYHTDLSVKSDITMLWDSLECIPDIIINNAGYYPFIKFSKLDELTLDKVMDINLNSALWMCQEFIKRKKKDGIIINTSSIEAVLPFKKDMSHYTVAKAGVISLTRGLARDFAIKGFRANVIVPGAIKTPSTKRLINDAIKNVNFKLAKVGYDFGTRLPMGRWGKPQEVATVIAFLASDMASYVNGASIPVDGGFLSA